MLCAQYDGDVVRSGEDSLCNAEEKPESEKECEGKGECKGQWFTGPWSECDKPCGGGKITRKILCLTNGVPGGDCNESTIEFATDECNKEPCISDETIPVDVTSRTIEEDDEGEEWCDEDDSDDAVITVASDVVTKALTKTLDLTTSFELDSSDTTESNFITDDEFMQSDATGFETESTQSDDGGEFFFIPNPDFPN